jgi:hypothetical protein
LAVFRLTMNSNFFEASTMRPSAFCK